MAQYNGQEVTDGITKGVEERKQRGMEIAAIARIEKDGDCYLVPSRTNPVPRRYVVRVLANKTTCNCLDF
jgi:hypothetical protein